MVDFEFIFGGGVLKPFIVATVLVAPTLSCDPMRPTLSKTGLQTQMCWAVSFCLPCYLCKGIVFFHAVLFKKILLSDRDVGDALSHTTIPGAGVHCIVLAQGWKSTDCYVVCEVLIQGHCVQVAQAAFS